MLCSSIQSPFFPKRGVNVIKALDNDDNDDSDDNDDNDDNDEND